MFVDAVMAVGDRVLREQTFDLVVAPAIADLQYDEPTAGRLRHARNCAAVLTALAWGLFEELTSDSSAFTFALLVLIPACYYTGLVIACAPEGARVFAQTGPRLVIGGLIAMLSFGPAIVCYWPEPRSRAVSGVEPRRDSVEHS
jgi:hypothetical protein